MYCLSSGLKNKPSKRPARSRWKTEQLCLLPGLIFDPEDGGNIFHQNITEIPSNYMMSHPRRQYYLTYVIFLLFPGITSQSILHSTFFSNTLNSFRFMMHISAPLLGSSDKSQHNCHAIF
jgi:hypothetical protein